MVIYLPDWPVWLLWLVGIAVPILAGLGIFAGGRITRRRDAGEPGSFWDKFLVTMAVASALVVWGFLFASLFLGITGFSREFLGREGFAVYATALTTDAVVVVCILVQIAMIRRQRPATGAKALIWGMTGFSAFCGFAYGEGGSRGNIFAGIYLAVMSVVSMILLHLVIDLFTPVQVRIRGGNPRFGLRWITHWSTLPAFLAWINHPPEWDSEFAPTVREALDHWEQVRIMLAQRRQDKVLRKHQEQLEAAHRAQELAAARRPWTPPPPAEPAPAAPQPAEELPARLPVPPPAPPAQPSMRRPSRRDGLELAYARYADHLDENGVELTETQLADLLSLSAKRAGNLRRTNFRPRYAADVADGSRVPRTALPPALATLTRQRELLEV